jgi:hypothetical protein
MTRFRAARRESPREKRRYVRKVFAVPSAMEPPIPLAGFGRDLFPGADAA